MLPTSPVHQQLKKLFAVGFINRRGVDACKCALHRGQVGSSLCVQGAEGGIKKVAYIAQLDDCAGPDSSLQGIQGFFKLGGRRCVGVNGCQLFQQIKDVVLQTVCGRLAGWRRQHGRLPVFFHKGQLVHHRTDAGVVKRLGIAAGRHEAGVLHQLQQQPALHVPQFGSTQPTQWQRAADQLLFHLGQVALRVRGTVEAKICGSYIQLKPPRGWVDVGREILGLGRVD